MNPMILAALAEGGGAEAGAASAAGGSGADALKQITHQLEAMKGPATAFNQALSSIQIQGSAATTIITTFGNALEKIPLIGPQLQQLTLGFADLESKLKSLNQFVAGFSPFDAKLLDRAFADLNASFGEQLVPVIRAGTQVVRWFADTIAGLTPVIRPLIEEGLARLTPWFQFFGDAIRNALQAINPLIPAVDKLFAQLASPEFANEIQRLSEALAPLLQDGAMMTVAFLELAAASGLAEKGVQLLTFALKGVTEIINQIVAATGAARNDGLQFQGAGQGKAFLQSSQTSPNELLTRMQTTAFGMGSSSPAQKTAENTGRSINYLQALAIYFTGGRFVNDIKSNAISDIKNAVPTFNYSVPQAGRDIINTVNPTLGIADNIRRLRRRFD